MSEAKYGIEPKGWYNERDLRDAHNFGLWAGAGYCSVAWAATIIVFLWAIGAFG